MDNKKEDGSFDKDYPVSRFDRRRRNLSRPNASDRREYMRYLASFPVTVKYPSLSGDVESMEATILDISEGGVMLEGIEIPDMVSEVTLEFRIPKGVMPEQFVHGDWKSKATVRFRHPSGNKYGVEFEETLGARLARTTWARLRLGAVVFFLFAVSVVLLMKYENLYLFLLDVPIFLYSILVAGYLITRFVFAAFYRRAEPLAVLPKITVIAPVFNEREHVGRMIAQVMESAYPAELMQFIVINDGSTDGTEKSIEAAREKYPEVEVITHPKSLGKRHGMSAGADRATGDFLVFIDSDSFLAPNALKNLMKPFADPKVAAVTGHCDVENVWTNTLTRMQAVRYYVAFKVMKAAESVFDSVTCLSGPLAAYRKELFMEVREEWLNQTFFGQPATFGDDRSLTNSLLVRGHKVVYADDAITTTIVPDDHRTFLRQQMRWKRSWFRETLRAMGFMWRRPPLMSISFYLGFILPLLGPAVVLRSLLYIPLTQHRSPLIYIMGVFLMSCLISCTYLFLKRSRLWFYGIIFCFYYMLVLIWQLPWAVLTFSRTLWGTRN
jgi:hyaluronan synthase